MDYKQIPVIIPSLEPDEKLPRLLEQLHEAGIQNIVLVDDGSGPAYAHFFEEAQKRWGCPVLRHAVNLGKGRALKTAFNYCLNTWPDAPGCVTADSDGQHTPACILKVMKALTDRPDALILGCRNFDEKDVPLRSSFGNKCTRFVFKALVGLAITDTQTGLRAIPTAFMKKLMHTGGERFEFESNMLIDTKDAGVPIVEVPIETVYIEENKTSHFNPLKDSARIYAVFGKFLFSSLSSSVVDLALFSLFCFLLAPVVSGTLYITLAHRVRPRDLGHLQLSAELQDRVQEPGKPRHGRRQVFPAGRDSDGLLRRSGQPAVCPHRRLLRAGDQDLRGRVPVLHQLPDSAGIRLQKARRVTRPAHGRFAS